jgi:hypothetical protein
MAAEISISSGSVNIFVDVIQAFDSALGERRQVSGGGQRGIPGRMGGQRLGITKLPNPSGLEQRKLQPGEKNSLPEDHE